MIGTSIWCTKVDTEMSVRLVVSRGAELNKKGSKRWARTTGASTRSGGTVRSRSRQPGGVEVCVAWETEEGAEGLK